jgi:hypothetical protein
VTSGTSWKRSFDTRTMAWERFTSCLALVPAFGPTVALVLLWDDPGSTSFILTAIGLGIVLVGIWLVSNVWKTPT